MRYLPAVLRRVLAFPIILGCGVASMGAEPASSADPSTYLCDVQPSGVGMPDTGRLLRLEEDDTTHRFRGSAVLVNDKLRAVLPQGGLTVKVYSETEGMELCARLQPVCSGRTDLKRTSLTIRENTRTAVSLEVGFLSPQNEPRQITYELNAGQPFIKTTASAGVEKLRVQAPCRFAVLPDFFADDIVVDASTIPVPQAELPSENFLLHMLHGGEAIVMTVSESRDNDVVVSLSATEPREIVCSDISYGKKPHVWIAVLAGPGIWHEQAVAAADAGKVLVLDWRMPYPALWRVDWGTSNKLTDSWEMLLQHPDGRYLMQNWFGQDPAAGQRFGAEFGARDWNKPNRQRWNPVLGSFPYPCWVDTDGSGHLQPILLQRDKKAAGQPLFLGPTLVYPLDRVQMPPFTTPLEKLTVVDLVRMTLGVGPCQYILDLEGQKRNSRGVATCYARDVINAIYKEGTQLQNGPVIVEHLDLCVAFIRNVRERIDQYVQWGRDMRVYLEEQRRLHPGQAEFLDESLLVVQRLDQLFEERREKVHSPEFAQQQAEGFRTNLLQLTGPDAYDKCAAQMSIFTSIGGTQDDLVAACRTVVKTLRQRAGIALAVNPELKDIATEIRNRTQAMLRNPTAYEAPQH